MSFTKVRVTERVRKPMKSKEVSRRYREMRRDRWGEVCNVEE